MLTEDKEDPFLSIQYSTHHLGNWIERDSVMRVGRLADDSLSRLFICVVFLFLSTFFIKKIPYRNSITRQKCITPGIHQEFGFYKFF